MATLTGSLPQWLRNHTAALLLGLPLVRRLAAEAAAEISIGYPHSPLNAAGSYRDPAPGTRASLRTTESSVGASYTPPSSLSADSDGLSSQSDSLPPVGAGDRPRFVLFADPDGMPPTLQESYADLLEPTLREPFYPGGMWLVRPDGYIALSAKTGDWNAVTAYLTRLRS
jgi:hypothetical protein